jgi:hypothetical protein
MLQILSLVCGVRGHMSQSVNINMEPLIYLLFYMWDHHLPYQSIHVALSFFHVQLEVTTKLTHRVLAYITL